MSTSKVLTNLNVRKFPSLASYKNATVGEDDLNVVLGGKPLVQVTSLPEPSAAWAGEVVQVLDTSNGDAFFYMCMWDGMNAWWQETTVQTRLGWETKTKSQIPIYSNSMSLVLDLQGSIPLDCITSNSELLIDINTDTTGQTNTNHFSARVYIDSTGSGVQTIYNATGVFFGVKAYINMGDPMYLVLKKPDGSNIVDSYTEVACSVSILGISLSGVYLMFFESPRPWGSAVLLPVNNVINYATVTLAAADWSSNTQTITVNDVKADSVIMVSPTPANQSDYAGAGILCTAQAAGSLTFTCNTVPSSDVTVTVVIL